MSYIDKPSFSIRAIGELKETDPYTFDPLTLLTTSFDANIKYLYPDLWKKMKEESITEA